MTTAFHPPLIQPTDLSEARAVNQRLAAMDHPDVTTTSGLATMRATLPRDATAPMRLTPTQRTITTPHGQLRLRILRPPGPVRAVMLNIHGGGWCLGTPESDDLLNDTLATGCQIAAVSVDYRLAPEHPHPAGLEDCTAALDWLARNARTEFDTDILVIAGSSAGAHLAVLTLLHARDTLAITDRIAATSLIFGCYDISGTPSQRQATPDTLVLNSAWIAQYAANTFHPHAHRLKDPDISPLYADLTGLPPALFTVGTLDPLLDDTLFMAARWQAAGAPAQLHLWPECAHGFLNAMPTTGAMARIHIQDWITTQLPHRP